jgi:hypothetical protein
MLTILHPLLRFPLSQGASVASQRLKVIKASFVGEKSYENMFSF